MPSTMPLLRRGSRGPDVVTLQSDLNALPASWRTPAMPRLDVDGAFGPQTADAVRGFQTRARITADGIVGDITRARLREALASVRPGGSPQATPPATAPAAPVAPSLKGELPPEERGSPHEPRQIPPDEFHLIHYGNSGRWGVDANRSDEPVRAGQQWSLGREDVRLIYEVLDQALVYLQLEGPQRNAFFAQTRVGFRETVRYSGYIEAAKGARGMVLLAEHEAAVIMGIAMVVGPGRFVFKGVNLLKLYVDNQAKVHAAANLVSVGVETRTVLRRCAPTLWRAIVQAFLFCPTEFVRYDPDAVALKPLKKSELAGKIVGTVLMQQPGRILSLRTAIDVLKTVTIAHVPAAAKGVRIETDARKLMEALLRRGERLGEADARRIMEEVATHETEIKGALGRLDTALVQLQL